jgi:hypothetical protein
MSSWIEEPSNHERSASDATRGKLGFGAEAISFNEEACKGLWLVEMSWGKEIISNTRKKGICLMKE